MSIERTVRTAALDCGTNSVRLLIADVPLNAKGELAGPMRELVREMTITRLGQGVDRTGRLDPEALQRTFEAVEHYAALCRQHGVDVKNIRMAATSATRDAANRDQFVTGVRERLGVEPEVVSGAEEARLSFMGALSVRPLGAEEPVLVVDIGGGSTELVLGDSEGVRAAISMDIGSVRMTERHVRSDPPAPEEIEAARRDVRAALDEAEKTVPLGEARAVIGLAGSITTLAGLILGLPEYQRNAIDGREFSTATWSDAAAQMLSAPRAKRQQMGFLHPGRVDVIAAGSLVWQEVLARVVYRTAQRAEAEGAGAGGTGGGGVSAATVSEHDILDGIALGIALRQGRRAVGCPIA